MYIHYITRNTQRLCAEKIILTRTGNKTYRLINIPKHTIYRKRSYSKTQLRYYINITPINVSIYTPYHITRFARHNEFAWKDGHRESADTPVLVLRKRY